MTRKIIIIGAHAAGLDAASAARKTDRTAEITLITKEKKTAYSRCGIPFVLGRHIPTFDDLVVFPETGGCRRSYGDSTLLLLRHPIHNSCPLIDFPYLVSNTCIKKNALRSGSLPSIDMRHDTDVSDSVDRITSRQFVAPFFVTDIAKIIRLPSIVSKSSIGFCHFMRIFSLFYRSTSVADSIQDLCCQLVSHAFPGSFSGKPKDPPDT